MADFKAFLAKLTAEPDNVWDSTQEEHPTKVGAASKVGAITKTVKSEDSASEKDAKGMSTQNGGTLIQINQKGAADSVGGFGDEGKVKDECAQEDCESQLQKQKERKKAHEKARKQRRRADADAKLEAEALHQSITKRKAKENFSPRGECISQYTSTNVRLPLIGSGVVGEVDVGGPSSKFKDIRFINGGWIPGLSSFVMLALNGSSCTGAHDVALIKHAIKYGAAKEWLMIAQDKEDHAGSNATEKLAARLEWLARPQSHGGEFPFEVCSRRTADFPSSIFAPGIQSFRRCYPAGSDPDDWHLLVKSTPGQTTDHTLELVTTSHICTDGSVEEALFTRSTLPLELATKTHITLPLFREALYSVKQGSKEKKYPIRACSYDKLHLSQVTDAVELARWTMCLTARLDEKKKDCVRRFADTYWNRKNGNPYKLLTGRDSAPGLTPGLTMLTMAVARGVVLAASLDLKLVIHTRYPSDIGAPSAETIDKVYQWGFFENDKK